MHQAPRKWFHILSVTPFAILTFFIDSYLSRKFFIGLSLVLLVLFLGFEVYRLTHAEFNQKMLKRFSRMYKKEDERKIVSSIWGPINLLILVLFFSKAAIVTTTCIGCYADPLAALFGMKYGKKKNKLGKTWIGSIAFFATSVGVIIVATYFLKYSIPLPFVLGLSFVAALAERYVPYWDDNFVVAMVYAVSFEIVRIFLLKA